MKNANVNSKETESPQNYAQWQLSHLLFPLLVCSVIGGGIVVARFFVGDDTPPLNKVAYQMAKQQWDLEKPSDYRVVVEVRADKTTTYSVEVRNRIAQSVLMNQTPLTEQRVFDTWTIPGMFNTIAEDIEHLEDSRTVEANSKSPRLRLWCRFDPQHGLPMKYRRLDWDKGIDVTWQIKEYQPLPASQD